MSQEQIHTPMSVSRDAMEPRDRREPSLGDDFHSRHGGYHDPHHMPRRPFHPSKCAFDSSHIMQLAASGNADAIMFVDALLDAIEDNSNLGRPNPNTLNFTVNAGTPSSDADWIYSVKMILPFNARLRMVRTRDDVWSYVLERLQEQTARRPRPMHPRRPTDGPDHVGTYPTPVYQPGDYVLAPTPEVGGRFIDL